MSTFNSSDDIAAQFPVVTVEDSIRNKDWAAGSSSPVDVNDYYWRDGKLQYIPLTFPPSLYKCIDEVVVNALDHMWKMLYKELIPNLTVGAKHAPDTTEQVSAIDISIDHAGLISITNNGRGIPVVMHPVAKLWLPQHIFGTAFQGSNYVKDEDNIVGGTNGIGAKIANIKSSEFTLETVDAMRKLKYRQTWRNGMRVAEAPVIEPCGSNMAPMTRISFRPLYTESEGYGYKSYADIAPTMETLITTRAINAALYATMTTQCARSFIKEKFPRSRKLVDSVVGCRVTANGAALPINTLEEFTLAATGGDSDVVSEMLIMRNEKTGAVFEWDVRVVVGAHNLTADFSVVDGIIAPKGTHISYLYDQIVDAVRVVVDSKGIKPAQIRNAVNIFCVCKIANPKWEGQRKEEINNSKKQYKQTFSKATIESIKSLVVKYLEELLFANDKKKVKKSKPKYEKYEPAKFAHSGKPAEAIKCRLVLTEGDSAMTTAIKGLIKHYGNNYYGFMSTGGVIMNVVRETIVKTVAGRRYCDISPALAKNEFFSEFLKITGLRLNCEYLPGAPEWRDLNYGGIHACLDQDLDGLGKIFPQVIAMFKTLWPNLLRIGYVARIPTPIIRCYPDAGGHVDELYTDQDYAKWLQTHNSDAYKIKYYKGLATHTDAETIHMFEDIENKLLKVEYDADSDKYFEIYLDENSNERKRILSMPISHRDDATCLDEITNHRVKCSDVLRYDADHFQRDDLNRKLIGIDGMNESGRKILDAAIKVFRNNNKEIRVSELAAKVVEFEVYHHGEASLYDNIKGKAFVDVGGKQLPLLLPFGNFGSRRLGGKDGGQPRYVHTKLNKRLVELLYPSADYGMLKFVVSEGTRAEPVWFPGVIPAHLCEHTEMPAHGWKIKVVARDALDLISATRTLIYNGPAAHLLPPRYFTHGWTGTIRLIDGSKWSCGRFNVFKVRNTNYIRIVELPIRTWTQNYLTKFRERVDASGEKIIRDVVNDSPDRVDILITLYDGALEALEKIGDGDRYDGIEQYFELRTRLYENLNFMGINGEVICFDAPEAAIRYWYPHRRELYIARTERKCIMLELKIQQLEQKQRYIESGISILDLEDGAIDELLQQQGFLKIYKKVLDCPDFIANDKIVENVLNHKKSSYKYLIDGVNDRARTRSGKTALAAEIAKLKLELLHYKESIARDIFPGAREWLYELSELEKVIKIGRETNWTYDRGNKFTFAKNKK